MINPLGVTMSVRDMEPFNYWLNQIDFIDRLVIKYHIHEEAHRIAREYFFKYKDYTHILMLAEDVIQTPDFVRLIIQDIKEYDFPVVCGYCNWAWKNSWTNVTIKDLRKKSVTYAEQYQFINAGEVFRGKVDYPFQQVFYNGLVMCCIRRDIMEKIPFRPYKRISDLMGHKQLGIKGTRGIMFDLAFAIDCADAGIPMICDMRCFCIHGGLTVDLINIVEKDKSVFLIKRKS